MIINTGSGNDSASSGIRPLHNTNFHPDLSHRLVSLGHNELIAQKGRFIQQSRWWLQIPCVISDGIGTKSAAIGDLVKAHINWILQSRFMIFVCCLMAVFCIKLLILFNRTRTVVYFRSDISLFKYNFRQCYGDKISWSVQTHSNLCLNCGKILE